MRRWICFLLAVGLAAALAVHAGAVELDVHEVMDGMGRSWYQGYVPVVRSNRMTIHLPLRADGCVGDITVSIALEDPHVYLLAAEPKDVTVSPKNGLYPVKLTLSLERDRRNGDYPAVITVKGTDEKGQELVQTLPYVIRIRDGYATHESLEPMIEHVGGELNLGSEGQLMLTITNHTTTLAMTGGVVTVTDPAGEMLMSGSDRVRIPEILPGKSETVAIPMTVLGTAAIKVHTLKVELDYEVLGEEHQWEESFTVPVTQAIRLEQGGVQLPQAIAGELASMTLPLMNMGKGELQNVLVKLEMEGVLEAQSVLVGTLAAGETKQAKLTFIPKSGAVGTHDGTVTVTCEDAYGNEAVQTLDVTMSVDAPLPAEAAEPEETEKTGTGTIVLGVLCVLLAAALVVQSVVLTGKLHRLEEERL